MNTELQPLPFRFHKLCKNNDAKTLNDFGHLEPETLINNQRKVLFKL